MRFRILRLIGFPVIAAAFLWLEYARNPVGSHIFPPCPFHLMTGWYCPGCGSLRALHQLLHGHVMAALGLNPLFVLLLPWMTYVLIARYINDLIGRPLPGMRLPVKVIVAIPIVLIVYGVVRNLPFWPCNLLRP